MSDVFLSDLSFLHLESRFFLIYHFLLFGVLVSRCFHCLRKVPTITSGLMTTSSGRWISYIWDRWRDFVRWRDRRSEKKTRFFLQKIRVFKLRMVKHFLQITISGESWEIPINDCFGKIFCIHLEMVHGSFHLVSVSQVEGANSELIYEAGEKPKGRLHSLKEKRGGFR